MATGKHAYETQLHHEHYNSQVHIMKLGTKCNAFANHSFPNDSFRIFKYNKKCNFAFCKRNAAALVNKMLFKSVFFFSFLLVCANDFATGVGPGASAMKIYSKLEHIFRCENE